MNLNRKRFKEQGLKKYNLYRDRLIKKYLKSLRNKAKASGKAPTPEWSRYESISETYYGGRNNRPFILSNQPVKPHGSTKGSFISNIEMDPESPRYGLVKEGYYFLIMDGAWYQQSVRVEIDEELGIVKIGTQYV